MSFECKHCGETHDGLPDIGYKWPDSYFGIPEDERETRIKANSDICSIDDEDFFVRGVLLIPVHGEKEAFGLGVWATQKKENFETYVKNYNSPDIGPFFGWLSTALPFYEESTWALPAMVHYLGNDERPVIELEASEHSLYTDWRDGITLDRAWEFVHWHKLHQ